MASINLIEAFQEFKEAENIDRPTMMKVVEDVFKTLLRKKYGSDENFDVIVNAEKGDLEIIRRRMIVEDGAVLEHSVVRGPAIIGRGARVIGSYIGPFTAIGPGVEIRDTEVEHSIVLEGASIRDLSNRVTDSLIGRNVRIYREPIKPSAYRFMLGDNSEVGIRW